MSININEFVRADISVSPAGIAAGNFGILGFLTNESGILVPERSRAYKSLSEVAVDWASTSEVYKAATAFYAQTPQPTDFTVITTYDTAQSAVLLGGGSLTLAELTGITIGDLTVTIDGVDEVMALDLSTALSYSDVADLITAELVLNASTAVCSHNGTSFLVTSSTAGFGSTISYGTGTSAEDLGFAPHQALISQGSEAETPVDALNAARAAGTAFVALVTNKLYRDSTAQPVGFNTADLASWAEASKVIFMNTTNDLSTLSTAISTDVSSQLKALTLRYSHTVFSKNANQYPSASVFGRVASVNFEGIGTTITMNLKQLPTISIEDLTSGQLAALQAKNCNVLVVVNGVANVFVDSTTASGSWLDTTHGLLWLEDRIEKDLFNLLYTSNTKIPYTQTGINVTKSTLEGSLAAAVRNGFIAPGFLPDGTYLPNGYLVTALPLADVLASDKSGRIYRGLSFKAVGAGALHKVFVSGEFSE